MSYREVIVGGAIFCAIVAVVLATVGGAATCAAVLVLFLGASRNADVSVKAPRAILFGLFGGAIVFTLAALVTFLIEMIMAGRGLRVVCRQHPIRAKRPPS